MEALCYFKIPVGSDLGLKFLAEMDEINACRKAAQDWVIRHGNGSKKYLSENRFGGVSGIIFNRPEDIPVGWVEVRTRKARWAARPSGRESSPTYPLYREMQGLPIRSRKHINDLIGFEPTEVKFPGGKRILEGFAIVVAGDYLVLALDAKSKFERVKYLIEITGSEFQELTADVEFRDGN